MFFRIFVILGVLFYFPQGISVLPQKGATSSTGCAIINIPQDQPGYKALEEAAIKSGNKTCGCCAWSGRICMKRCCIGNPTQAKGECSGFVPDKKK